eukprot:scaffold136541_cov28-Tisochrysis_lutea.AAC.4
MSNATLARLLSGAATADFDAAWVRVALDWRRWLAAPRTDRGDFNCVEGDTTIDTKTRQDGTPYGNIGGANLRDAIRKHLAL